MVHLYVSDQISRRFRHPRFFSSTSVSRIDVTSSSSSCITVSRSELKKKKNVKPNESNVDSNHIQWRENLGLLLLCAASRQSVPLNSWRVVFLAAAPFPLSVCSRCPFQRRRDGPDMDKWSCRSLAAVITIRGMGQHYTHTHGRRQELSAVFRRSKCCDIVWHSASFALFFVRCWVVFLEEKIFRF